MEEIHFIFDNGEIRLRTQQEISHQNHNSPTALVQRGQRTISSLLIISHDSELSDENECFHKIKNNWYHPTCRLKVGNQNYIFMYKKSLILAIVSIQ